MRDKYKPSGYAHVLLHSSMTLLKRLLAMLTNLSKWMREAVNRI